MHREVPQDLFLPSANLTPSTWAEAPSTSDEVGPSYSYAPGDASLRASCPLPPLPLPPLLQPELHVNWQNWHQGSPGSAGQVLRKLNFISPASTQLGNVFTALLCEQLHQNDPN